MSANDKAPHWAEIGESTFVFGIWLLFWLHRCLGRWPFRLCIYPVVALHWWTHPLVRQSSHQYFERLQAKTGALGRTPDWRDGIRHLAWFAETMLDKLVAASGRYPPENVKSTGREAIYAHVQKGQGGMIITAHMGCLELCRMMEEKRGLLRLNVLVHTRHAEKFNRILKRLNPHHDVKLIEVTEVSPATAVFLAEKVAAGEFIAIAGDRVPVFASKTVEAQFLGYPAPLPVGPYILASLLQCPVYVLACIHEGEGYRLHFTPLADRIVLPRRARDAAMRVYAQRYVDALTDVLVRSPYDWFNFFPFWDQIANETHADAHVHTPS